MSEERIAYCINCGTDVPYETLELPDWILFHYNGDERVVRFNKLEAVCPYCSHFIYAPEINDQNVDRMEEAVSRYKQAF